MPFETVQVRGQYTKQDGVTPASGSVVFERTNYLQISNEIAAPVVQEIDLDANGVVSVTLIATDDPNANPANTTYRVTEKIDGANKRVYHIEAPNGVATLDLASVVPAVAGIEVVSYALTSHSHANNINQINPPLESAAPSTYPEGNSVAIVALAEGWPTASPNHKMLLETTKKTDDAGSASGLRAHQILSSTLFSDGIKIRQAQGDSWSDWRRLGKFTGFQVRRVTNFSIPNGSNTLVQWDEATVDTEGGFATPNYTVPVGLGGYWMVKAELYWQGNATGRRLLYINKNGSGLNRSDITPDNSSHAAHMGGRIIPAVPGDTFSVTVFQDSGIALNLQTTTTHFEGHFLGH